VKKIKILLLAICCLVVMPFECLASSANINVTGTSTAVVGNKVTVTVTLSSSTKIGSWQMNLNYDKSYLQLTNSTAEAGGTGIAGYDAKGLNKKTYTFTFKTLKTGSTKVSVGSYLAYDYNTMDEMSLTANSKMIKIITQQELEASYSKDNNLASLDVEGFLLSPSFEKDVTEYAVVVPEDTKSIKISAKARDGKASVSGTGEKEVTSGTNNFEITVRAENGSEKVYKINVEVKDANPINANVDGNLYTVVKIKDYLPSLNTYQDHTILIEDMEIPAYKNDNTGLVLVGLKDSAGEISLFIYDENDGSYKAYHEIGINKITVYPMDTDEVVDGYQKKEVNINGVTINGFVYEDSSRFIIIYGVNVETGEKGFYLYDKDDQSIVKYNDEYINGLKSEYDEKIKLYSFIIIGFSIIFVLMFLILIFKRPKKKRRKNKKNKQQVIDDNKNVEILEL